MVLQLILLHFIMPKSERLHAPQDGWPCPPSEYAGFINTQKVRAVLSYQDVNAFMTVKNRRIQQLLEFS